MAPARSSGVHLDDTVDLNPCTMLRRFVALGVVILAFFWMCEAGAKSGQRTALDRKNEGQAFVDSITRSSTRSSRLDDAGLLAVDPRSATMSAATKT